MYDMISLTGRMLGLTVDRIRPEDVIKKPMLSELPSASRANDDIQVNMTGTRDGQPVEMHFFPSLDTCTKFITDNGLSAPQAPKSYLH
jgi:hypothetical protein